MAYNRNVAQRLQSALDSMHAPAMLPKKMFGGIAYLLNGNMACGIHGDGLIIRVGEEKYLEALSGPGASVFDMTGRPMKGWVVVTPQGFATQPALIEWLQLGIQYAQSLPSK